MLELGEFGSVVVVSWNLRIRLIKMEEILQLDKRKNSTKERTWQQLVNPAEALVPMARVAVG